MTSSQELSVSLFDRDVQECPYQAYRAMRETGPVYKDPVTGFYVVTRYDLLRKILLDTENFTTGQREPEAAVMPLRFQKIQHEFNTKGWLPGPSLGRYDDRFAKRSGNGLPQTVDYQLSYVESG